MRLEPGLEVAPDLRLTQPLGRGGFGEVWEAQSPGGVCALKFVDCRGRPSQVVANELRILLSLRGLNHPYVIRLDDILTLPGRLALKMERADGSLDDLLQVCREEYKTHVPPDLLLDMLGQAAEALDFLATVSHGSQSRADLQHCDVKPANLLLVEGTLKVADFGLCAAAAGQPVGGGLRGTPPYAAPELYEGRPSRHTDQYALAVTFCELVSGDRMFVSRVGGNGPVQGPARENYPGRPVDLALARAGEWPVLSRALDRAWYNRWPSCRAFVDELRKAGQVPRGGPRIAGASLREAARRARSKQSVV